LRAILFCPEVGACLRAILFCPEVGACLRAIQDVIQEVVRTWSGAKLQNRPFKSPASRLLQKNGIRLILKAPQN